MKIFLCICSSIVMVSCYDELLFETEQWEKLMSHKYTFHTIIRCLGMLSSLYDITLHLDNETVFNQEEIVKHSHDASVQNYTIVASYLVINYDNYDADTPIAIPPSTRNVAHIIILQEPRNFIRYMRVNKKATDIAIFMCLRQKLNINSCKTNLEEDGSLRVTSFLHETYATTIYRVFIFDFLDDKGVFYSTCYYCGVNSYTMKNRFQENIINDSASNSIDALYWRITHTFVDLERHSLRLAFAIDENYFDCVNESVINGQYEDLTVCDKVEGIEGKMLTEIAKIMNFTFQLVTPHRSTKTPWGNIIFNLNESKVEWGIGCITVTDARTKMVTFSTTLGSDPLRYLYADSHHDFYHGISAVISFSPIVWTLIITAIMFMSVVLFMISKYNLKNELKFSKNIWVISAILLEQSVGGIHKLDGRFLIGPWLICALIISSAYKGKLSSMIINPQKPGIYSLDELAQKGYVPYFHKSDITFVRDVLKASNDSTSKALLSRSRNDLDVCDAIDQVLSTKGVYINEQNYILRNVNKKCAKNLTFSQLSRFRFPKFIIFPSDHAWPFRPRSPLLNTINKHLMRIIQSGLYSKWTETYMKTYINDPIKSDESQTKIDIAVNDIWTFLVIFLLWAAGMILSFLCFVTEHIHAKFTFKMKRSQNPLSKCLGSHKN